VRTLRFLPKNFDLLLQGPSVKRTTIRAGDKSKRFYVGEIIEARCNRDHRAVECDVTRMVACTVNDLGDHNARDDGFATIQQVWAVLQKLNPGMTLGDTVTIIGLRVVGEVRDTRFEAFTDHELETMHHYLNQGGTYLEGGCDSRLRIETRTELNRRKTGVQGGPR